MAYFSQKIKIALYFQISRLDNFNMIDNNKVSAVLFFIKNLNLRNYSPKVHGIKS